MMDWCTLISTVAAIIAAIYAMLTYHRPRGQAVDKQNTSVTTLSRSQSIIPITLALVAWGAVAFNYADLHYLSVPPTPGDYIQEYGVHGVNGGVSYIMKVNTKQLLQYSEAYKLAFVIRVQYADRDRMTDTAIEKSGLYTITDSTIILAHPSFRIERATVRADG
jgi:hypothetical protein